MRSIAERLVADEARRTATPGARIPGGFHVCDELRPHLTAVMGTTGFHALLSRALALTGREIPSMSTVQVGADGSLEGWDEIEARLEPDRILEGRKVLVAQLLGLLAAFIGEPLTQRLVHDGWPAVSLRDRDRSKEYSN